MNSQKKPPQIVFDILKKHKINYLDIDYYAWPQMFGSTAGPRPGMGGCAMTSFTIEAYVVDSFGPAVYLCCGMYSFSKNKRFDEPFENIVGWIPLPAEVNNE